MLKLYNTLSRKKEIFRPRTLRQAQGKKVNLFVCGITPYDSAHIGHARTYVAFDMIAKYLKEKGYDIFYLQNVTDIEDKIIQRAKEKKVKPIKLARDTEEEYLKDMKMLKIDSVTKYSRATDYIKEIQSQVKKLLDKGFAYKLKDGIYYDISKFKGYGKLSRRTVLQAEDAISRIDEAKEKKNKGDFSLWKYAKSLSSLSVRSMRKGTYEYEPVWPSPWGPGRPGWHIEDTAITEKCFGSQYDIHGGAKDLMFPHHEAEIAQMEAISGKKPMVKYWLHAGFLTVKGQKMAKSLGNFITIRDFLENHSPRPSAARILRLFFLKSHYRSPINYTDKAILQTKKQIERIDEFLDKLQKVKGKKRSVKDLISKTQKEFEIAMDDDFNTPKALSSLFKLITKSNALLAKNRLSQADARDILKLLKKIDKVFNFIFWEKLKKEKIPKEILKLVAEREKYRKQKNWKKADEIRRKIKDLGYQIEDIKEGLRIKRISA